MSEAIYPSVKDLTLEEKASLTSVATHGICRAWSPKASQVT